MLLDSQAKKWHAHFVEVVELFWSDDPAHELTTLQMFAWAYTHRRDVHLAEDTNTDWSASHD